MALLLGEVADRGGGLEALFVEVIAFLTLAGTVWGSGFGFGSGFFGGDASAF